MSARDPATKAPKQPKALPRVPTSTGTASASRPKCSSVPRPLRAEDAEPVGVVDHQPRTRRPRGLRELGQRCEIPVHAEHPVGGEERSMPRMPAGEARRGGGIGVRVAAQRGTREPRAVDERGVRQAVEQHLLAAPGERCQDGEVGHVAGREQQCPLARGEGGQLLLERRVLGAVAAHQVRGAAAGAACARRTRPAPAPAPGGAPVPGSRCWRSR